MLSNHVFEELTVDVYDEVDRRETDVIWNALHGSKVRNYCFSDFEFFFSSLHLFITIMAFALYTI